MDIVISILKKHMMDVLNPCQIWRYFHHTYVVRRRCDYRLGGSPPKKKPYPHMGVPNAYTQFIYVIQYPTASRAGPINVQSTSYFQEQHPSRANQPRALTSDNIEALVTP